MGDDALQSGYREPLSASQAAVWAMLNPRSVAIIGASPERIKLNGRPQHFLMRDGYEGQVWPVNPRYGEIHGLTCYPDIASLPGPPDVAIVAVAARHAVATVEALGARGCPVAVLFSSGFGEMGEAGKALEASLMETARRVGVRLCGPNTLGFINAFDGVTATFSQYADVPPVAGPVGFASQSGAFGTAISALARSRGLGLGYFVSTGNTADISPVDCLDIMRADDRIRVLAGYMEGLSDGPALLDVAARALDAGKPLVITKVGRNPAGARAAQSHTGSLAGEDRVFDWLARHAGIIRARNEEHMLDCVTALSTNPPAAGRGMAILTQSGGAGVLMADRAEEIGMVVPALAAATREQLKGIVPEFGATGNPVDVTGQFLADPRILTEATRIVLEDPGIDVAVIWLQLMHGHADQLVDLFREIKRTVSKPFLVCWVEAPEAVRRTLMGEGIGVIGATERVVDAAAALSVFGEALSRHAGSAGVRDERHARAPVGAGAVRAVATLPAADRLRASGLRLVETRFAVDRASAIEAARAIGYPVALKIESPAIPHKTEADGVRLGLRDDAAVGRAFDSVMEAARRHAPAAHLDGVVVQAMANPAVELVLGLRWDPVFGHVVMVGLGGIFIEVLKDVAFARAPTSHRDARAMLDGLVGAPVLRGARGRPPVDENALVEAIVALSRLVEAHPGIEELDLNPVFAGPDGVVAVDWLMLERIPSAP